MLWLYVEQNLLHNLRFFCSHTPSLEADGIHLSQQVSYILLKMNTRCRISIIHMFMLRYHMGWLKGLQPF